MAILQSLLRTIWLTAAHAGKSPHILICGGNRWDGWGPFPLNSASNEPMRIFVTVFLFDFAIVYEISKR